MKFSQYLHNNVEEIWDSYYEHPFVKGIGDGSLDMDKFKFYMIQDYIYLLDYARVYALGVVKADTEEVMQGFAQTVHDILNGEMSIHRSYMKKLGITSEEIKTTKASLANISYTNYMLAVSQKGTLIELSVSLLSCAWSYLEIGRRLSKIPGAVEHEFYGDWITGYSSKDYENTTKWLIDLVDELGKDLSQKEIEKSKEIFINSSKYEYMFWDMSYNKEL